MIFDDLPHDWRHLERLVAQAFNEMGCTVTSDMVIQKIRSKSQIDVYVQDPTLSPPAVYLCECKHWGKRAPKGVVQQFRTIISDAGANLGIIISQIGFQSGAHEEAKSTNVRLYSWEDFQTAFEERWTKSMDERFKKLTFECSDLTSDAYEMDASAEGYRLTRQMDMDLMDEITLLLKIAGWKDTVIKESCPVRICETGPELSASPEDRWIELRTKRQFYDYAIPLAEEHKRKLKERLVVLRSHPTTQE